MSTAFMQGYSGRFFGFDDMEKEQKLAFEYGQAASVSTCSFAEYYDSYMRKLVREARSKADHQRNKENMQAWYRGYIFQTALAGNGIPQ